MDLSILIISYNTRELTLACLESVFRETTGLEYEVIVVDNASADGSASAIAARFPDVHLVASPTNHGFGQANNLAAARARGEFLLLLNPDTLVLTGAVQELVRFARAMGGKGIYGGRTLYGDGSLNPTSCWGRITPWSSLCEFLGLSSLFRRSALFDPESLGKWPRDTVRQVDIVSGCFFAVSKAVWDDLGGFDPEFFMYGEEADFCLRARSRGIAAFIDPKAEIVHYGGASERVRSDKLVRLLNARVKLIRRHWPAALAGAGVAAVVGRSGIRALVWKLVSLRGRDAARESARCWTDVWRRRAQWVR